MMKVCFAGIKQSIMASCMVLAFLLGACTVQNSGSLLDNRQGKEKNEPAASSGDVATSNPKAFSTTFKADYLKPLQAIRSPSVSIQKEKRRLYVFNQDTLVREYPIGLGSNPVGDKEKDSDGRTPEGEFYICGKKEGDGGKKFLIISYPSRKHAEKAHFQGILPSAGVSGILQSLEKRTQPPAGTPLGGNVGIQGGGAHEDWTTGSVALYDSDMAELYIIADLGTPVYIRP